MNRVSAILALPLSMALAACNSNPESGSNSAEDFAARINGPATGAENTPPPATPDAVNTPTVAQPLPGAVDGPYVPGTMTDPASSICGANLMGEFVGQEADEATRTAITEAAAGNSGSVRFVLPGSATVQPDPTNPRLSIMIDNLGVIRDARCG
ncbi:MAG: I78 family peptidase inhibitor [Pseudomonadota bacterium]